MKKIFKGICIVIGAALCCAWCYLKADTLQRETKIVTKIVKGD